MSNSDGQGGVPGESPDTARRSRRRRNRPDPGPTAVTEVLPAIVDDGDPSGPLPATALPPARRLSRNQIRLLITAALLVLAAGVTIPLVTLSSPVTPRYDEGLVLTGAPGGQLPDPIETTPSVGEGISATNSPAGAHPTSAGPSATNAITPTPSVVTSAAGSPTAPSPTPPATTTTTKPPPSGPPPPFPPLTIEAEAPQNTMTGTAARASYAGTSGGELVGYIGLQSFDSTAGTLSINGINVPSAGTYSLTFYYIANSDRTAYISVNGGANILVSVPRHDACCANKKVPVTLVKGANTIVFSNPIGRCPAIDKIVISKP